MAAWLAMACLYAGSPWFRRRVRRRAELGALGALGFVAFHTVTRAALAEGLIRWAVWGDRRREELSDALYGGEG